MTGFAEEFLAHHHAAWPLYPPSDAQDIQNSGNPSQVDCAIWGQCLPIQAITAYSQQGVLPSKASKSAGVLAPPSRETGRPFETSSFGLFGLCLKRLCR